MIDPPPDGNQQPSLSDRELIARFIATRDEAFFRQLVLRHGALVWGTSKKILRSHQDCEDVFQATFLKLLMEARRNRWYETVGGWLHRVAYRLSVNMHSAKQRRRETKIVEEPWSHLDDLDAIQQQDAELALHEGIVQLPRLDQEAVLLCYFQGKSQEQAAAEMGCSHAAINSRLQRARRKLLLQLSRRGIGFSLAMAAVQQTCQAAQPVLLSPLVDQTVHIGFTHLASDGGLSLSPEVRSLCNGGYSSMFQAGIVSKMTLTVGCASLLCLAGAGLLYGVSPNEPVKQPELSAIHSNLGPLTALEEVLTTRDEEMPDASHRYLDDRMQDPVAPLKRSSVVEAYKRAIELEEEARRLDEAIQNKDLNAAITRLEHALEQLRQKGALEKQDSDEVRARLERALERLKVAKEQGAPEKQSSDTKKPKLEEAQGFIRPNKLPAKSTKKFLLKMIERLEAIEKDVTSLKVELRAVMQNAED